MTRPVAAFVLTLLAPACRAPGAQESGSPAPVEALTDPKEGEVPLPSLSANWESRLLFDNGDVGVWTVGGHQVFPQYAAPEVVALDDRGRCHVLVSYSGKWTPVTRVHDGTWLGGLAHGDVDARIPGSELYVGSQSGHVYQLTSHADGALDARLIAALDRREVHTIVAGDVDARSPGAELFVFTNPGALYRVAPTGPHGAFETERLTELGGRVRDAVLLPRAPAGVTRIATVSRAGALEILTCGQDGPRFERIHEAGTGMGRVTLAPRADDGPTVLYTTLDDGRVLRHEEQGGGWSASTVYAGPQGLRGIAAGRFDADPGVETVAVFGYSGRVDLLSRHGERWAAEALFEDRDKGHWLATLEVDGRNTTDEIVGCGYGGRVFLLQRPAGYGLSAGTPTGPAPP